MLNMPRILILHEILLAFVEHLINDGGDKWLVAELRDWGEQGFEVEDDGAGKGEAAKRLPVDSEMASFETYVG